MGPFNGPTIAILVILALLLFGAKKLPDLARSLGRSARILKAESKGLVDEDDETKDENTHTQQTQSSQQTQPSQQPSSGPAESQQQSYPQLPPGQRTANEAGESTHPPPGTGPRTPTPPGRNAAGGGGTPAAVRRSLVEVRPRPGGRGAEGPARPP